MTPETPAARPQLHPKRMSLNGIGSAIVKDGFIATIVMIWLESFIRVFPMCLTVVKLITCTTLYSKYTYLSSADFCSIG